MRFSSAQCWVGCWGALRFLEVGLPPLYYRLERQHCLSANETKWKEAFKAFGESRSFSLAFPAKIPVWFSAALPEKDPVRFRSPSRHHNAAQKEV